jgi:Flp pilus assembly protein TadD
MMNRQFVCGMLCGATLLFGAMAWNSGNVLAAPAKPKPAPAAAPSNADAAYKAGMEAIERGEYELALQTFQDADRLRADHPETLNMIGYSLRKLGKLDEARETYLRALSLKPNFAEAREYLGENYLMLALREMNLLEEYGDQAKAERKMLAEAFERYAKQAGEMAQ